MPAPSKILIAIPCLDLVSADFAFSLAAVLSRRAYDKRTGKSPDLALASQKGSLIMDARNALASQALAISASHILFWDSDIVVPPDALDRLIAHHKPIVGCTYVKRYPPHETLGVPDLTSKTLRHPTLTPMISLPFGFILISTKVLASLPQPLFRYITGEGPAGQPAPSISEDTYFCAQARAAGHTIWCDRSIPVGHVGQQVFRP